jgi:RNA polymerase sigma-70 factor, ECF subfamily
VPRVLGGADSHAAPMAALYDEHAAVMWRYPMGSTGDASGAEDVVRETLLTVWQHPGVAAGAGRSVRASLFIIAHNMIIDGRHPRFPHAASSFVDSRTPELSAPHEIDAALAWLVIVDATAQLAPARTPGRDRTLLLLAMDYRTDRYKPRHRRRNGGARSHYAARALRLTLQETW